MSFNARLRDELLNGEIFYLLKEAKIIFENWRQHYNRFRPHASLGCRTPAPEVFVAVGPAPTSADGHAPTGTEAHHELTFALDHSVGAGHELLAEWQKDRNQNRPHTSLEGLTPNAFAARSAMDQVCPGLPL